MLLFDSLRAQNILSGNTGFADAQSTAKELCEVLNIESELKEKRLRSTKRHFGYEAADHSSVMPSKSLREHF